LSEHSDDDIALTVSGYLNQLTEHDSLDVPAKRVANMSNTMANGMSKPYSMPSDTSFDESWKGTVKRSGYSKVRRINVSSDSSRSSTPEITQEHLPTAPLTPQNVRRGMGRAPKKPSAKDLFQRFLKDKVVMNSKHYDEILSKSSYLRSLEDRMPPSSIESVKKNIFNQNMYCEPEYFMTRILTHKVFPEPPELEYNAIEKAAFKWLGQIADDNNMTTDQVITSMFDVMNLTDSKISTIVLIGESNSS